MAPRGPWKMERFEFFYSAVGRLETSQTLAQATPFRWSKWKGLWGRPTYYSQTPIRKSGILVSQILFRLPRLRYQRACYLLHSGRNREQKGSNQVDSSLDNGDDQCCENLVVGACTVHETSCRSGLSTLSSNDATERWRFFQLPQPKITVNSSDSTNKGT